MILKLFIISWFLGQISCLTQLNQYCQYDDKKFDLVCEKFESFSNLNFKKFESNIKIKYLTLNPMIKLDLNSTLGIQLGDIYDKVLPGLEITLKNINSFELTFNYFVFLKTIRLDIYDSYLKFKLYGQDLTDCKLSQSENARIFDTKQIFFGSNVQYLEPICPIAFLKVDLNFIQFSNLDSYINNLKFSSLSLDITDDSLRSKIKQLYIEDSNLDSFKTDLLDKFVFQDVNLVSYTSKVNETKLEIDENLFAHFSNLTHLEISLSDMAGFVQNKSLEWINSLNVNVTSNFFKLVLRDYSKSYNFPDTDFCLFYQFPHDRNIYPIIYSNEDVQCSCTLLWLVKKTFNSTNENELMTPTIENCFSNYTELYDYCSFADKIQACRPTTTTTTTTTSTKSTTTTMTKTSRTKTTQFTLDFITNQNAQIEIDETYSIVFGVMGCLAFVIFLALMGLYMHKRRQSFGQNKSYWRNHSYLDTENINRF